MLLRNLRLPEQRALHAWSTHTQRYTYRVLPRQLHGRDVAGPKVPEILHERTRRDARAGVEWVFGLGRGEVLLLAKYWGLLQ
jgi:hypothetical protein